MSYEYMCDTEAATALIVDEFKENLVSRPLESKQFMEQIYNSNPRIEFMTAISFVNALVKDRIKK